MTASADNTAQLWDAVTGQRLTPLQGHASYVNSAAFSQDGGRVVTASADHTGRIWDAVTGEQIAVLEGHTSFVRGAAFSPDGARVVTASGDCTAQLWDAEKGAPVAVLRGHTAGVMSAAFDSDGTRVVTAAADNTARVWTVWPLLTADTVTYAAVTALRTLSNAELTKLLRSGNVPDSTNAALASLAATAESGVLVTEPSERGALDANPLSYRHSAECYEIGDQTPRDLEKALLHRLIEARLFEQAGEESQAAVARARAGSIARVLAPETVVRVAREAAT